MTNERLQELLNLILFSDEITTETDNAHIEICETFDNHLSKTKRLESICEELVSLPKGVESHSWSDYKMEKDTLEKHSSKLDVPNVPFLGDRVNPNYKPDNGNSYKEIEEKFNTGNYLCIIEREMPDGLLEIEENPIFIDKTIIDRHHLIHKRDSEVIKELLENRKTTIEMTTEEITVKVENYNVINFLREYSDENQYKLVV